MNCPEVRALSHAYTDRELDVVRATEVEHHLRECRLCSREIENIRALSSALKGSTFYFRAPNNLEGRIRLATCARNGVGHFPKRSEAPEVSWKHWSKLFMPVTASATVILVAIALLPRTNQRVAEEVVSSHVRSLMAEHLTDVASSSQHTVKPWFDGKIDFAPPVTNLENQGFPLIGGRLDYLQGRSVAAEVYGRNKHKINLFVWPASQNRNTAKKVSVVKGYNVISWQAGGMNYSAVSDLNATELREFADLLN
jgi:anti-sigma factor RsiW